MKMFASMLFCLYLDILTRNVFASMSQDFCGRVFETQVGRALVGHNMSSVLVGDEFECQLKCIQTQFCKSFNVHFASSQANKRVCDLNNETREGKPSDFKVRKGSSYYGSVKVSCVDVSHENKGKQSQLSAKTCTEIKNRRPKATSGSYSIDPDGPGGHGPFTVFCDMNDKMAVGVTVVGHDSESETLVNGYDSRGSYVRNVHYQADGLADIQQLAGLLDASTHCEQFIKYRCYHSRLFRDGVFGWWVARDGSKMQYWGGAKPTDYQKCACGVTIPNSCADPKYGCNCDKNDGSWREDSGLLTEKSRLPVTQLKFGDTGSGEKAYHILGKLKCSG
ncbi:contactin-associated protein-like 2 [Acropora millepora]|uniref:contactin-associated protein-like 2 n=1 Tax=Acropora millepora TaxID=45264 RepID=UPI001CF51DEB|nr:contactin-associated protein-like 2 [Acropora millepora]